MLSNLVYAYVTHPESNLIFFGEHADHLPWLSNMRNAYGISGTIPSSLTKIQTLYVSFSFLVTKAYFY